MDIRREIIQRLDTKYPDIPIHGEEIEQGFEIPSFFVKRVDGNQKKMISTRYKKDNTFDIHYFAKSNEDAELMSEKLYFDMEYLNDYLARGTKMSSTIVDGILHFLVSYNYHIYLKNEDEYMGKVKVKGVVKENE